MDEDGGEVEDVDADKEDKSGNLKDADADTEVRYIFIVCCSWASREECAGYMPIAACKTRGHEGEREVHEYREFLQGTFADTEPLAKRGEAAVVTDCGR